MGSVLADWQLQALCCTEHGACFALRRDQLVFPSRDLKHSVAPGPRGTLAYSLGRSPETPGRGSKQMCPCVLPGVLPSVKVQLQMTAGAEKTREGRGKKKETKSKYWLYRAGNKRAMKLI